MSNKLDVFREFLGKSANMVHRAEGLLVYANKESIVKAICHSLFIYYLIYASQPPYGVGIMIAILQTRKSRLKEVETCPLK